MGTHKHTYLKEQSKEMSRTKTQHSVLPCCSHAQFADSKTDGVKMYKTNQLIAKKTELCGATNKAQHQERRATGKSPSFNLDQGWVHSVC